MEKDFLGKKHSPNKDNKHLFEQNTYSIVPLELKSEKFNQFYKDNLSPYFNFNKINDNETDFDLFLDKMKEKLPCVFRVNKANTCVEGRFLNLLTNEDNLNKEFEISNDMNVKVKEFGLCTKSELIFNINIPKNELRKNLALKKFHKFIQFSVDAALISRQEAVSMIPPYLLDVKPGMSVFDMCAAPGSKTGQFLENLNYNYNYFSNDHKGYVLANDNNFTRAYMMTHQLQRFNTADFLVVSHDSQVFPRLFNNYKDQDYKCEEVVPMNERLKFDRILADVPCSSDAVLRKLPHKWKKWTPKDALHLHKLQLTILKRGISLLKDDGLMVYSTCSLSPIENEAVVAEALRIFPDEIELIDCSEYFNKENVSIKKREGLTSWKVYVESEDPKDNTLLEVENINSDLYKKNTTLIAESCFNNLDEKRSQELKKCIRILPHDSNTSGFFIVLLRKIPQKNRIEEDISKEVEKDTRTFEIKLKGGAVLKDYGIHLLDITKNAFEIKWLTNYYGLRDDFPFHQLVSHSDKTKKINFITNGVYRYLKNDLRKQVKIITAGIKIFNQTKSNFKDDTECRYRLCQNGVMYVFPYITKRIFSCNLEIFSELLKKGSIKLEDIETFSEEGKRLVSEIKNTYTGCVVLVLTKKYLSPLDFQDKKLVEENYIEVMCCYLSKMALACQISKNLCICLVLNIM